MEQPEAAAEQIDANEDGTVDMAYLLARGTGLKVVLSRMCRNADLAKDAYQDVMEAAIKALKDGRLQSRRALPAYLHTCAKHAVQRLSELSRRFESRNLDDVADFRSPLDVCVDHELGGLVQKALMELNSERDRDLIRAFYLSGVSKPALLTKYEINDNAFDKVLSRARMRLRELLMRRLNPTRSNAVKMECNDE